MRVTTTRRRLNSRCKGALVLGLKKCNSDESKQAKEDTDENSSKDTSQVQGLVSYSGLLDAIIMGQLFLTVSIFAQTFVAGWALHGSLRCVLSMVQINKDQNQRAMVSAAVVLALSNRQVEN